MVPATEQGEVREHRRSALSPVNDVMTLSEPHAAAREATTLVAMVQRSSDRRRDRACPGGDLYDTTVLGMLHHDAAGIARQASGRFRGNVGAVLEHGLTRR